MANNIKIYTTGDCPINYNELTTTLYKRLNQVENISCELSFVDETEIQSLNKEFRNIDSVTDVLSFPTLDGIRGKTIYKKDFKFDIDDEKRLFIGSIAICTKRAKEQAIEYGHSEKREITYLLCHGLLHLFGYDHMIEEDKKEMRSLEEEIMNEIKVYR